MSQRDEPEEFGSHGQFDVGDTVLSLILAQCRLVPDKIAVECGTQTLTYRDIDRRSSAIASWLVAHGASPGKRVGLCVARTADMVCWLLGIWKTGAAYVPIDPSFPADRRNLIAGDAQVQVLVSDAEYRNDFSALVDRVVVTTDLEASLSSQPGESTCTHFASPNDTAYIIYTSGSTGKPKGVVVSHRAVKNFLQSMQKSPGLSEGDRLLAITTLSFDISVLEVFLPLVAGATLIVATREQAMDGQLLKQLLTRQLVTVMQGTPASWQLLLDSGWEGDGKLKMLCGGEALQPGLAEQLLARGGQLWNMYGPTETTVWSAVHRVDLSAVARAAEVEGVLSVGTPIANTQLYVLDESKSLTPLGVAGQLYIGGDGLATGYFGQVELTEEKFIDNPWRPGQKMYATGDLVKRKANGELVFLGRIDHQVKIRGFRIELGEIETALAEHPSVEQSVVMAKQLDAENRLVAYLIAAPIQAGRPENEPVSSRDLRQFLKRDLPDYMLPSHFVWLDAFPQTPNRKVDRARLPSPEIASGMASDADIQPACNKLEQQIVNTWKSVLGLADVGVNQDFFDLGGTSLAAARMMRELEEVQGQRLPLALLISHPTVKRLAGALTREGWEANWKSLVPIDERGNNAPLYCIHAAGGNILLYRDLARHFSGVRPIYGLQSEALAGDLPSAPNVQAIAAAYVAEIRALQPTGVYNLCGYCLGGTIAYEMAVQLKALGCDVGTVALFDTHPKWVRYSFWQDQIATVQQIYFHAANVLLSGRRGVGAFVREKLAELRRRRARRSEARRSNSQSSGAGIERKIHVLDDYYDRITEAYDPQRYDGKVVLFQPRSHYVGYGAPALAWKELVPDLRIVDLPVYPAGMLLEPFVSELAQNLSSELD